MPIDASDIILHSITAATRNHNRLVSINPFRNSNGRHARLMTDLLKKELTGTTFTWGKVHLAGAPHSTIEQITSFYPRRIKSAKDIAIGKRCKLLDINKPPLGTYIHMDELTSFSLRIPKALAVSIDASAKRSGVNKSEYACRAMEEFEGRGMHERIAELSRRLAVYSASAARSMEGSTSDGFE